MKKYIKLFKDESALGEIKNCVRTSLTYLKKNLVAHPQFILSAVPKLSTTSRLQLKFEAFLPFKMEKCYVMFLSSGCMKMEYCRVPLSFNCRDTKFFLN